MSGRVRLGIVAVMVVATLSLAVSGFAGAATSSGNILPKVTNSKPVTGGTLKIVGNGDVDHLDTCCAYYTTTYEMLRMVSRQLLSYKAGYTAKDEGTPVPDLASSYTVSSNGLTYTFHIRQGVDWDTPTGPRQVTSQDEVRGIMRLCNPINGAPPIAYWTGNIAGMASYCTAFEAITVPTSAADQVTALNNFYNTHTISGLSTPNSSTIVFKLLHPSSDFLN
ncbi:MAG: ABC transporter substrate-binding protein, partial [Acidimicrobiales bacterium]